MKHNASLIHSQGATKKKHVVVVALCLFVAVVVLAGPSWAPRASTSSVGMDDDASRRRLLADNDDPITVKNYDVTSSLSSKEATSLAVDGSSNNDRRHQTTGDPTDDMMSPSRVFRYASNATPLGDLLGSHPIDAAAVCELFVLGNPNCDVFLTGEKQVDPSGQGAMIECIETYGVENWDAALQLQCTQSEFWRRLKRTLIADRRRRLGSPPPPPPLVVNRSVVLQLMDPIMRQHIGPLTFSYVPPERRTYATYASPLVCARPILYHDDDDEPYVRKNNNVTTTTTTNMMMTPSLVEIDQEEQSELSTAYVSRHSLTTTRAGGGHGGGGMILHPISFGYPSELLVRRPYRVKLYDWYPLLPSYFPFFRRSLFRKLPKRPKFEVSASDEYLLMIIQRLSYFSWTHMRGGPDCMRHYEILAAGGLPYFYDLPLLTGVHTLSGLPKASILNDVLEMPGVSQYNIIKTSVIPPSDFGWYNFSDPPASVLELWQHDQEVIYNRWHRRPRAGESSFLTSTMRDWFPAVSLVDAERCFGWVVGAWTMMDETTTTTEIIVKDSAAECRRLLSNNNNRSGDDDDDEAAAYMDWLADALHEERFAFGEVPVVDTDEIVSFHKGYGTNFKAFASTIVPVRSWAKKTTMKKSASTYTSTPQQQQLLLPNETYVRVARSPVINVMQLGAIDWANFSTRRYRRVAEHVHKHTKAHLSAASVAAYVLKTMSIEVPRNVLLFTPTHCDYLAFTVWRGLLELGLLDERRDVTDHQQRGSGGSGSGDESQNVIMSRSSITTCAMGMQSSSYYRMGPALANVSEEVDVSELVRNVTENGSPAMSSKRMPHYYREWAEDVVSLNRMYGKNFFVGRRIPQASRQVSVKQACADIRSGVFDLVVISVNHPRARFGSHPCAQEIRFARRRFGDAVRVALLDGHDEPNVETLRTFHEENITLFVREPRCW